MAVNKVIYGGVTLVDMTEITVTEDTLLEGASALDKSGQPIAGKIKPVSPLSSDEVDAIIDDTSGDLEENLYSGPSGLKRLWIRIKSFLDEKINKTDAATDSNYGLVKTNPAEAVTLNEDGQLDVGGRLGQFTGTTGVFAPKTIKPALVDDGSFLLTEGSGTSLGKKSLAVSTGRMQTCRSAAAGSTVYRVQNTYVNRIACSILAVSGGVVALSETEAKAGKYANVVSVQINGAAYTPDSSANQTAQANDIVITLDKTVNPSSATTSIRFYPGELGFSIVHAGMGVGSKSGYGASVLVGQGVVSDGGNACAMVGADLYNTGNGNALFGRQHISRKNRWFMVGTGHDNTNGKTESGAVFGEWASISADTAFAIGNGTSHTARSNLFEIKTNGDMYLKGVKIHSGS